MIKTTATIKPCSVWAYTANVILEVTARAAIGIVMFSAICTMSEELMDKMVKRIEESN